MVLEVNVVSIQISRLCFLRRNLKELNFEITHSLATNLDIFFLKKYGNSQLL